jgi:pentatricopeptide repeat protein
VNQIPTALQFYQRLLLDFNVPEDAALIATVSVGLLQPTLGSNIIPELSITIDSLLKISPIPKTGLDLSNPGVCLHVLERLCAHPSHHHLSDKFLEYMQEHFIQSTEFQEIMRTGHIILLKYLFRRGMVPEAFGLFNRMLSAGILPDQDVFSLIITSIHKQRGLVEVLDFYHLFKEYLQSAELTAVTRQDNAHVFNTVIQCFSKMGKMEEAEQVFEEMGKFGISPTLDSFKMLLIGYCRIREDWTADKDNTPIDPADFLPSADRAKDIVDNRIGAAGLVPDGIVYQILLRGLAVRQDSDDMLKYYQIMLKRGLKVDESTYLEFADALARMEMDENFLKDHFEGYIPPENSSEAPNKIENQARIRLIQEHCRRRQGNCKIAIDELNALILRGLKPTLPLYTSVIAVCAAKKEIELTKQVMDDMESRGVTPDAYVYHILMNLQVQDDPHKVLDWYAIMQKNGIPDYDFILELVFEAFVNLKDLDSAEEVLKKLTIDAKIKPLRQTYYKLIRFLIRSPKLSYALLSPRPGATLNQKGWIYGVPKSELFDSYYLEDTFPRRKSYPKALVQPSNFAMGWATELFHDMVNHGYKPARSTIFHLSLGFISRGESQQLWDLYEASWDKYGQSLDLDFRGIIYSYFWESGQMETMVDAICKAMEKSESEEEDWNLLRHLVFDRCIKEPLKESPPDSEEPQDEEVDIVVTEYDGSENMLASLQELHPLFRNRGREMSPALFSDALYYTANVSKNETVFGRLWDWMVQEKLVKDGHVAYFIERLAHTERWGEIYHYCTDWMTQREITMTPQGISHIASVLHQSYMGLVYSAVLMYWRDRYPTAVLDAFSRNSSFVP